MPWVDYEEIIGCGDVDPTVDDYNDTGNLTSTVGAMCGGVPLSFVGALSSTCGPVAEIDSDDAGVCEVDEPAFTGAAQDIMTSCDPDLEDPDAAYDVGVKGRMSTGSTVPVTATIVAVTGIWVGSIAGGGTFQLRTQRIDETTGEGVTSPVFTTRTNSGALERYEIALPSGGLETLAVRRNAAINRLYIQEIGTEEFGTYQVAFLGIKVTWSIFEDETPLIPLVPPQRVFPREDGLLGPGAQRVFPPPRSRQRSPRIRGGYL